MGEPLRKKLRDFRSGMNKAPRRLTAVINGNYHTQRRKRWGVRPATNKADHLFDKGPTAAGRTSVFAP